MSKPLQLLLCFLLSVGFIECGYADDANSLTSKTAASTWPSFRGPSGQGLVDTLLPTKWSEEENHLENIAWKCPVPGKGWSSPVATGGHIWMTTAVEHVATDAEKEGLQNEEQPKQRQSTKTVSLRAVCVDAETGKLLHDIELFSVENPDSIHTLNSYASPTPVLEQHPDDNSGDRLYCHFGTFGTTCLDTKTGEKIWEKRFPSQHAVGPGSSPIVWEDLLVLVCDGMEAQYVMALNKNTGDAVWRTDRPPMEGDDGDFHKAFSTALAVQDGNGEAQLLVPGAQWFVAYEARNGKMLWHINHGKGFSNVAAPVYRNGVAYLVTGFTKPELWAIPVSSRGELKTANVLWEQKKQIPKKSSPLIAGNEIYVISDKGVLSCVDAGSGEIHWVKRLGGNYSASPILAGGLLYFCSHEGKTTVVRANAEKYEEVAENQLDGQLMASPIAVNGTLYLRSDKHLYRIR